MTRYAWRSGGSKSRVPSSITQLVTAVCLTPRFTSRSISRLPAFHPSLILATFALVVCFFQPVRAQSNSPDSTYQRQQERERALRQQQEPATDVRLPDRPQETLDETLPEQETPCFSINQIVLLGQQSEQFADALKVVTQGPGSVLGRCLGVGGVRAVLARVQNVLIAQGYVTTRVLVAPQNLSSGELQLTLVPGHVRAIRFAPDADARGTWWNALPIRPGDLLNLRDIEQGLENFKRVPTVEADIKIAPAEGDAQPGDSDLVLAWQQAFPFRLNLSADNSGSKATGKYQGSATVSYDNWWTLNDLFYVSFNHDLGGGNPGTRGSGSSTMHYAMPIGYWSWEATTSNSQYYQSVAGINQTYIYRGQSENTEIKLSRLVYRDATRKTTLSFKGFLKTSSNFIDDTEVQVQRRRTAGWELGVAYRELLGASTLDLSAAYRHGTGAFAALPAPEEAFGEGTARFKAATADVNLVVPFSLTLPWGKQNLRYNLAGRGQWNDTPLTPQERFSIGSRYTVRGFDGEQSLLADRGWYVRNDLGIALAASAQELYLGLDFGTVDGPSSGLLAGRRLAGAVVGVRGGYRRVNYELFAGTPLLKPTSFRSAPLTVGFTLNCAY
jgi:hemolysin activation/secretion protein